jgi:predicted TIM-barrel fold metal-dependent hydrolase
MFIEQFLDPFVDLFAWGILERHPKLKIVIAESGVGWVPWVVEELDYRYWRLWECSEFWADKGGIPHKMKPSEVFQRQVYGTFQQSPTAMRLLEFWGPSNMLWASDYPHPDSIWPELGQDDRRDDGAPGPRGRARARRRQCGEALRAST